MGFPVPLRDDFDAAVLRLLARRTLDANRGRRLLALATVYDGGSRADAARIGSVGLQTVRDWVLRFNAAGPDGLVDGKAPGTAGPDGAIDVDGARRVARPRRFSSGEIDSQGRIGKCGDAMARTALYEAANVVLTRTTVIATHMVVHA